MRTSWALRCRLELVRNVALIIKEHLWGIINAIVLKADNGRAEGMNGKIQRLKSRAYGYYHQLTAICLVRPGMKTVLPLMPEPITQQVDASKNDCEVRALERILKDLAREHYHLKLILNFDDLYSKGPTLKLVLSYGHHFIAVAKASDHASLMETLDDI